MSYSELHRSLPNVGPAGRSAIRTASRTLLVASATIVGDLLLFGVLLIYAGVFEL